MMFLILLSGALAKEPVLTKVHCRSIVDARLDPIVNPGTCSGHMHTVFGGLGFGPTVEDSAEIKFKFRYSAT